MGTGTTTLALAAAVALGGCAADEGRPPLARISLSPTAIPEHDNFQTVVVLDGAESADPVDDPAGAHPLTFAWELVGDEARFEPGSRADDEAPSVRFLGERPATVVLTVTDADGLSASATSYLRLTVR